MRAALRLSFFALLSLGALAAARRACAQNAIGFRDVTEEQGLRYSVRCGSPEKRDIIDANGVGAAVLDADLDGELDIFFAQGSTLEEVASGRGAQPSFWRRANGRWYDASAEAGLRGDAGEKLRGWWTCVTVGDADDDGYPDVFVGGYLKSAMLMNGGSAAPARAARFTDATRAAGLEDRGWVSDACFFDADRDGRLDLYMVRYIDLDPRRPPRKHAGTLGLSCTWRSHDVYCGPKGLVPQADRYFKNLGGGKFAEATIDAGFSQAPASYGLGVCPLDFDNDGFQDLYIANDSKQNFLWRNAQGQFLECAFETGVGLGEDGSTYSGMGVVAGDINGDGLPDLVVTNFSEEPVSVYTSRAASFGVPKKPVLYDTSTWTSDVGRATLATLKWGVEMEDLDLDGDLDLFICNGHVYPQADLPNTGTTYEQRNQIFVNDGAGKFAEWKPPEGSPLLARRSHRILVSMDYDHDGAADFLILPVDGAAVVLHNECPTAAAGGPHRVELDLRALRADKKSHAGDAVGAHVTVVTPSRSLVRDVRRSGSYASSRDPKICIGLGAEAKIERVDVRWADGAAESIPGAGLADRLVRIEQGRGAVEAKPLAGGERAQSAPVQNK